MAEFTLKEPDDDYVPDSTERKVRPLLPPNRKFLAEVLEAEAGPSPFWVDPTDHALGKKDWVNFKFSILDDGTMTPEEVSDYVGAWVWGNTPVDFTNHPDCKLRQWAMGILGVDDLPANFKFDLTDLVGAATAITVYHRTGKDKTGAEKTYQNVGDVIPAVDAGGEAMEVF